MTRPTKVIELGPPDHRRCGRTGDLDRLGLRCGPASADAKAAAMCST